MKHLVLYPFIATLLLVACNDPSSEILPPPSTQFYKDLNDVEAGYTLPYLLDIDNDGISEYRFTTGVIVDDSGEHLQFVVYGPRNNGVLNGHNQNALPLAEGDIIEASGVFSKGTEPLVVRTITPTNTVVWYGDWRNLSNRYIGIAFRPSSSSQDIASPVFYGWIKISFNQATEKIIIHEMGYQIIPDTPIRAGEKK